MSRGPKTDPAADWRPTASWEVLRRRAALLVKIREFFAGRGLLEVETPVLAAATVTDLHLHSLSCRLEAPGGERTLYLQTSPEFAMKRLLAAGSGPIFQICKAFRNAETGRCHNPEFTILEWYRPHFDHHALMDEMDELLGAVLGVPAAERVSYGELFERHLGVDPHRDPVERLKGAAARHGIAAEGFAGADRDGWLQLVGSHLIEPRLGRGRPTFVFDYPASQAALARIRAGPPPVAERFEVFVAGLELANGYHELTGAREQRRRFEDDLGKRRALGREAVPIDERLLAALESGMPDCAGVALGVDRLAMLEAGVGSLAEVVALPIERA
ncbi:MAG: EF-P lysine aminoacylase GenX [bacterium]|nr:EF-P lysine aminoacylase GenX [bacterium]